MGARAATSSIPVQETQDSGHGPGSTGDPESNIRVHTAFSDSYFYKPFQYYIIIIIIIILILETENTHKWERGRGRERES